MISGKLGVKLNNHIRYICYGYRYTHNSNEYHKGKVIYSVMTVHTRETRTSIR